MKRSSAPGRRTYLFIMTNTLATLISTFLATGAAASPSEIIDIVEQAPTDRGEPIDIVTDAPTGGVARSPRETHGARLTGPSAIEGGSFGGRTISFRELVAARVVLEDGDAITDAPVTLTPRGAPRALDLASGGSSVASTVIAISDLGTAVP